MKIIRKTGMILGMVLIMLFGNKVEAADSQADLIVERCTEAMKNTKVFQVDAYAEQEGTESETPVISMASDKRGAGIYYAQITGYKAWADEKTKMKYVYNAETEKYIFVPLDKNPQSVQVTEDNLSEVTMEIILDMMLESLRGMTPEHVLTIDKEKQEITYLGEEVFKGIECYKLQVTSKEKTAASLWYIRKQDNRIYAAFMNATKETQEGEMQQIKQNVYFSYPNAVTIPGEAKKKASLKEGYQFTKSNISYRSKKVKGKVVLYVMQSKKAKNKIKIPDYIKINGKKYNVYGIDAKAFYNNGKIKSVTIGNNVRTIGDKAFYNNKKMTSVTIGKNVRTIGKYAFYKCKALKTVKITSKNISKIGSKAFYKNAKTLKVKVPKKKATQYKGMIKKSKVSSKLVISKY